MVVAWGPRVAGSANHEHGESHRRAYQRETAPRLRRRVECVIADTCIAGMAESAACEEKFSSQNVGVTITVTPCWCYGSETIDMDPLRPKAIWGFNGTERPGAVYLAAALAAHSQKGSRRSPSTDMTCRMPMTPRSRRMSKKSCCASLAPARLSPV